MRYIGFDVGDGESAIAAFEQGSGIEPVILPVGGSKSFLSAAATGLRENSGLGSPLGLPRWEQRMTLAPFLSRYSTVGKEATIRLSSATVPSGVRGTL